jgi:hypothetical protein
MNVRGSFDLLALALVLTLPAFVSCKRLAETLQGTIAPAEAEAPKPIRDDDYRFELVAPEAGWKLLPEADAQKIAPSAIAGAVAPSSRVFGMVIAEQLLGMELPHFVDLVVGQMPLEGKVVEERTNVQYQGEAATRVVLNGTFRDIPLRYSLLLFEHDGYGYQLLAWGTRDQVSASDLSPFAAAFKLLPGEVRGRSVSRPTVDTQGVGWRVKSGNYESAVTGLRFVPQAGFRVLIGDELGRVNSEATVGWISQNPDVYTIVLTERFAQGSFEGMRDLVTSEFKAGIPNVETRSHFELPVLGETRSFEVLEGEPEFTYVYGAFAAGEQLVQLIAWYARGAKEHGLEVVKAGAAGLSLMGDDVCRELATQLGRLADPQNTVGRTFALRRGRYLDFDGHLSWSAPESGIWEVSTGTEARAQAADATLYLREARSSTYGKLSLEPATDPERFHSATLAKYPAVEVTSKGAVRGRGKQPLNFTVSGGTAAGDGLQYEYRIATAVRDGTGYALLFWGMKDLLDERASLDAVRNLEATPELKSTSRSNGEYQDLRLGFAVRLPDSWAFADQTPAQTASVGTVVSFSQGNKAITIVAMAALSAGQDEAWFTHFLTDVMREPLAKISSEPSERQVRFLNQPARQITYESLLNRVDLLVFTRDRTSYGIVSSDRTDETFELARKAFRLLD